MRTDLVELNHFVPQGKHQFSQLIWYEWSPEYRRHHVLYWRLANEPKSRPVKTRRGLSAWLAGREILATHYRETTTRTDPERLNQKLFAGEFRPRDLRER